MATISPVPSKITSGCNAYTWETITENDTGAAILPNGLEPIAGNIQVLGTIGGATVSLQGSNNGTDFVTLQDAAGDAISFTVLATKSAQDFTSSMAYFRPFASGGTGQDIDVIIVLRG